MSGLYDILEKIKQKPGIYLGVPSISALRMFLVGYQFARRELGIATTESESDFYKKFQPWLQKRFQVQTVNSWDKIILLYSVDEKEAFTYFFKLLEEFLKENKNLASAKMDSGEVEARDAIAQIET